MKLDRHVLNSGKGKYALLKLRQLNEIDWAAPKDDDLEAHEAIETLERLGVLDWGFSETESEFFVIRLKDEYAKSALEAYARAAYDDGNTEWAGEIEQLCNRSGPNSLWRKRPD